MVGRLFGWVKWFFDKDARVWEFFEDVDGIFSMTRLLSLLAYFPSAYVTCTVDDDNKITAMGLLLGAYVLQTGVNKLGEVVTNVKKPATVTNIENAEKVENKTEQGNINVTSSSSSTGS